MSRNKQWRNNPANSKGKASAPKSNQTVKRPAKSSKQKFAWVTKLPMFIVLFVVLWLFLFLMYGDVFRVAEQRSFFTFEQLPMQYYLVQKLGWLYATGRCLLVLCKFPWLGTLMIAGMLVLGVKMIDAGLRLRGWMHLIPLAAPFGYVAFLVLKDLNLFYYSEASWITNIPLFVFVAGLLVFVVGGVARMIADKAANIKNICSSLWKRTESRTIPQAGAMLGAIVVLAGASITAACTYAENARVTCMMESCMYKQDWESMIKLGQNAKHPTRTVTALYALALNETDRMEEEIYNIKFQYPDAHLSRTDGSFDGGLDFIVIDCNFSAGLTRSAYHEAMEQMVLNGPSVHHFKRMAQCALVDGEFALAEKYLDIISKVPFESEFVEKYSAMIKEPELITQDQELACTIDLLPDVDGFEQNYREPMFLGYNVALTSAKNVKGLKNSLYACLYSKNMNSFGERVRTFIENGWPLSKPMQEAVVIMNVKNLSSLKPLIQNNVISKMTLTEFQSFMGDCFADAKDQSALKDREAKNKRSKEKALKYPQYRGTYEYYYYFQNIPDENYSMPETEQKGGVN